MIDIDRIAKYNADEGERYEIIGYAHNVDIHAEIVEWVSDQDASCSGYVPEAIHYQYADSTSYYPPIQIYDLTLEQLLLFKLTFK